MSEVKVANVLRYAALLGIAAANTVRARHLKFDLDLERQRKQLLALPVSFDTSSEPDEPAERPFCGRTCTRISGEVVTCYLPWDHEGFHAGRASGLAEAFTWPDRDADGTPRASGAPVVTCACQSTVLQADIVQTASEWKWRIFDIGCDGNQRLFALGASEDLDESRDDVVDTMRLLADNGGYEMSQPSHLVTHHVAARLEFVGDEA